MSKLCTWLAAALGDGENPSSSRLIAVPSLLAIYLVPLAVWVWVSLSHGTMAEVPASVLGLIGTVSAPLLAFVHWNKREENKSA